MGRGYLFRCEQSGRGGGGGIGLRVQQFDFAVLNYSNGLISPT